MARATDPILDNSVRTWDSPAAQQAREDRASNAQFGEGARASMTPFEGGLAAVVLSHIGARVLRRRG